MSNALDANYISGQEKKYTSPKIGVSFLKSHQAFDIEKDLAVRHINQINTIFTFANTRLIEEAMIIVHLNNSLKVSKYVVTLKTPKNDEVGTLIHYKALPNMELVRENAKDLSDNLIYIFHINETEKKSLLH